MPKKAYFTNSIEIVQHVVFQMSVELHFGNTVLKSQHEKKNSKNFLPIFYEVMLN